MNMSVFLLILFLATMVVGIPLPICLGIASITSLLMYTDMPANLMAQTMFTSMNSFLLVAVPLFVLVGILMERGGVADRLFDFANATFRWLPGGMGHVVVVTSVIFGGVSGSSVADIAALGRVEYNAMIKYRYEKGYTVGLVMSTSALASIIPPSVLMIIAGSIANESIGLLLLAGIAPGIFIAGAFMVYNHFVTRWNKMGESASSTLAEIGRAAARAAPPMLTPAILLYGIFDGFFTPTEAAAIAVAYTMFLSVVCYRTIAWHDLASIFLETAKTTGTILFIAVTAKLAAWIFTFDGLPAQIAELLGNISDNPTVIMSIIFIFLILVGMFMDAVAALYILVPVLLPPLMAIGVDPIHFLVVLVVALSLGLITPPVGVCLFAMAQVCKMPIEAVIRGAFPATCVLAFATYLLFVFPQIILYPLRAVGLY